MRIFAFHLLNDYSGSPKVLMQLAKTWVKQDHEVTLVTCNGRRGFLSDLEGVTYIYYWYRWASNPFVRLFNLTLSQFFLFIKLLFVVKKEDVLYVNTVLPFGAAFLGKIKGCRVIYHIHETSMKPALLKKVLFGLVKWSATEVIYVSEYLQKTEKMAGKQTHILYNAIENSFLSTANAFDTKKTVEGNVLMVCSLKEYKGVFEFLQLALLSQQYKFRLVVNASEDDIELFFKDHLIPSNLTIYPTQINTHPFYQWADVILNLSRPATWIETFGLTIIEGMAYGLPAIVPPIGGITELIEEGLNGYKIDSGNTDQLSKTLTLLLETPEIYWSMRNAALKQILRFSETEFEQKALKILNKSEDVADKEFFPDFGIKTTASSSKSF